MLKLFVAMGFIEMPYPNIFWHLIFVNNSLQQGGI